jgi:hypothetical protein
MEAHAGAGVCVFVCACVCGSGATVGCVCLSVNRRRTSQIQTSGFGGLTSYTVIPESGGLFLFGDYRIPEWITGS